MSLETEKLRKKDITYFVQIATPLLAALILTVFF